MSLEERIDQELTHALKAQDARRLSTLRLLKSAIHNAAIEKRQEHVSDTDTLTIISRQMKQRRESIEAYRKGGRADLVAQEEAELAVLQAYEPPQLSDGELQTLVDGAIAGVGATGPADQGKVMKQVMTQAQGRADGKRVSQLVTDRLKARAATG